MQWPVSRLPSSDLHIRFLTSTLYVADIQKEKDRAVRDLKECEAANRILQEQHACQYSTSCKLVDEREERHLVEAELTEFKSAAVHVVEYVAPEPKEGQASVPDSSCSLLERLRTAPSEMRSDICIIL